MVLLLTDIILEFIDIFFPMKNCKGVMRTMQHEAPMTALMPSLQYNKYMRREIYNQIW